jgi:hypothetical protein
MARIKPPKPPNPYDSPVTRASVKATIATELDNMRHRNRVRFQLFYRDGTQFVYGGRESWPNKAVMLNRAARYFSWGSGLPRNYQVRKDVESMIRLCLEEMITEGALVVHEVQ